MLRMAGIFVLCGAGLLAGGGAVGLQGQALQTPQTDLPVLGDPANAEPSNSPETSVKQANSDTSKPLKVPLTHAPVEMIPLAPHVTIAGRKSSYSFKVAGSKWVDTGVVLNAGELVELRASGTLKMSDGREASPAGSARGWKDLIRQFPVNSATVGAVVARVGDAESVPFLVGEKKDVELAQGGHLFLAVNLSSDLTATGEFEVKINLLPGSKPENAAAKLAGDKVAGEKMVSGLPTAVGRIGSAGEAAGEAEKFEAALSPSLFTEIPRRVVDEQGNPGDMVNFSLLGAEDQVVKAFAAAGWTQVDKTKEAAVVHGLLATLQHEAYVEMPMSTLYLFGRPQDLSYARAAPLEVAAIRHHLRVWKTEKTVEGKPMWVGSATHDNGFEKDQRNGKVTHHIDANIDEERDFIEKSFVAAGVVEGAAYLLPENALQTARTATGGTFQSDGRVVVMDLK